MFLHCAPLDNAFLQCICTFVLSEHRKFFIPMTQTFLLWNSISVKSRPSEGNNQAIKDNFCRLRVLNFICDMYATTSCCLTKHRGRNKDWMLSSHNYVLELLILRGHFQNMQAHVKTPITNQKIMWVCSPSKIYIQVGCTYIMSGGKKWGNKEIEWLEFVHKKGRKKKLAGSNLCSQIIMSCTKQRDCIHACWSVTPTDQVPLWSVILGKHMEVDQCLHVISNSVCVYQIWLHALIKWLKAMYWTAHTQEPSCSIATQLSKEPSHGKLCLQSSTCDMNAHFLSSKNYPLNRTLVHGVCVKARLPDHPDQQKCKPKQEWASTVTVRWVYFLSQKTFATVCIVSVEYLCCLYMDLLCYAGEQAASDSSWLPAR